jgi:hypothetical protein
LLRFSPFIFGKGQVMKRLSVVALAVLAFAWFAATQSAANELANPGFEADAAPESPPVPGASGWTTFGNANTTSASLDPVRTGTGSLRLVGAGSFGVPGAYQTIPANPGETWDLQGYMLTPNPLPANATFGLLKLVWSNGASDLAPGPIIFGQAGPAANPGIEALAHLDSASTPNTWQFTQARGVAPAGTTAVKMFALFVDQSAGTGYFDDLQGTLVPAQVGVPGDYNDNHVVDAPDYVLWRNNLGAANETGIHNNGDGGGVTVSDYTYWKARFGNTSGAGVGSVTATVPEPASFALLMIAAGGCCIPRGRSLGRLAGHQRLLESSRLPVVKGASE